MELREVAKGRGFRIGCLASVNHRQQDAARAVGRTAEPAGSAKADTRPVDGITAKSETFSLFQEVARILARPPIGC